MAVAVCSVSDLLAESSCFTCQPGGIQNALKLALLCRIMRALDPAMTCDVATLLSEAAANCFVCQPAGIQAAIELQLLCNISGSLASGGVTQQVLCGIVPPTTAPTNGCSIYYDKTSTAFYFWDGAAWQLKV